MDNVSSNPPSPLTGGAGQPIRPEAAPATGAPNVSRAPLSLGGAASTPVAAAAPKAPVLRPVPPKPAAAAAPAGDRITTCKMFFTKLHPGALHFLEEQVTNWLKDNPAVVLKRTDVITGEILEKKSEPSLIIVIWY